MSNFWKGKPGMTHGEIQQQLLLYLDGELTDEEMHHIQEHLSSCAVCTRRRDKLASVWRSESRLERVKPSPFLWTRLEAGIKEYEQTPRFVWEMGRTMRQMPLRPLPALALLAAIVVGIYVGTPREPQREDWTESLSQLASSAGELGLDQFDVIPPGALGRTLVKISRTQN